MVFRSQTRSIYRVSGIVVRFFLAVIGCVAGTEARGEPSDVAASPEAIELFEKKIRPLFIRECQRCHGVEKQQGNLRLDLASGWQHGGDSGPAIVPSDPAASLLYEALRYDAGFEMPPRGKLADAEIAAVRRWIELGAYDPRDETTTKLAGEHASSGSGSDLWSFQPIKRPDIPPVADPAWPQTDIDRFILARLDTHELRPGLDADRVTLLRRLSYDLTGLPPTPEEIDAFVADQSDDAVEKLVDRLLKSRHFGERWGRHWLDVVRFAESSGGGRTLLFPNAWRYRDYVIEAFNTDRPYNQFVTEQIAGDLLTSGDWQERRRQLVATGFLLLGPTNYELQDKGVLELDVVDEQLDTIGKAFMGMTLGCARCHDHKFDPIPTRDYYALAGILKSTKAMIHSNVSTWNKVSLPLPPELQQIRKTQVEELAKLKQQLNAATSAWKLAGGSKTTNLQSEAIDPRSLNGVVVDNSEAKFVGEWMASTSIGGFVGGDYSHDQSQGRGEKSATYQVTLPAAGEYEVRVFWTAASNRSTKVPVAVQHADGEYRTRVNQRVPPADHPRGHLLGQFAFATAEDAAVTISNMGTTDGVVIADAVVFVPIRSNPSATASETGKNSTADNPQTANVVAGMKREVERLEAVIDGFEKSMVTQPMAMVAGDDADAGDIPLAIRGVAHEEGPIIPRGVLQAVGCGCLGEIPDGQSGRRQLSEWLADPRHPLVARVYVNRVWHWLMGRGLVASVDNFGMMGQEPTHPALLDHLAHEFVDEGWSTKQLIRRIVLSRTYQLSSAKLPEEIAAKDPSNRLLAHMNRKRLQAEDIRDSLLTVSGQIDLAPGGPGIKPGTKSEYGYRFESVRRSVYVPVFRNTLHEIFEVFDFADPNIQQGKRSMSTVASQALLVMNGPFVRRQAEKAANQMLVDSSISKTTARIDHAWKQVLGRLPTEQERSIAIEFVGDTVNKNDHERWTMIYHGLFQSPEFRFVH